MQSLIVFCLCSVLSFVWHSMAAAFYQSTPSPVPAIYFSAFPGTCMLVCVCKGGFLCVCLFLLRQQNSWQIFLIFIAFAHKWNCLKSICRFYYYFCNGNDSSAFFFRVFTCNNCCCCCFYYCCCTLACPCRWLQKIQECVSFLLGLHLLLRHFCSCCVLIFLSSIFSFISLYHSTHSFWVYYLPGFYIWKSGGVSRIYLNSFSLFGQNMQTFYRSFCHFGLVAVLSRSVLLYFMLSWHISDIFYVHYLMFLSYFDSPFEAICKSGFNCRAFVFSCCLNRARKNKMKSIRSIKRLALNIKIKNKMKYKSYAPFNNKRHWHWHWLCSSVVCQYNGP